MVRKNQVASQPSRGLTEQRRSTSLPDGSDALPLLPLRSTRSSGAAANAEEPAGSQRLTAQDSNANDQLQSSAARLDALLEEWEPPDDKVARLAHIKTHYHHELFSLSDTQTQDLAEFGQGLALYFYFLKWMAVLLAAMSLIVLPSCAWYGIARQTAATTTGVLVATSLGAFGPLFSSEYVYDATSLEAKLEDLGVTFPNNQLRQEIEMEFYYQNASSADAKLAIPIGGTMSKQKIQWLASWLDFASIMLFLLAAVFIVLYQQHVLIEVASRTVTVVDYSVQVWDLPQDALSEEVQAHFLQYGPVAACQLAHNNSALIALVERESNLQEKYELQIAAAQKKLAKVRKGNKKRSKGKRTSTASSDTEEDEEEGESDDNEAAHITELKVASIKRILQTEKQLQQLQNTIRSHREEAQHKYCVCAFVTFKTEEARLKCMQANPSSIGRRWAQRRDKRFRKRHALKVLPAPEPSDVLWENLECGRWQRLGRRIIIAALNFVIIAIGFILVNLSASWRKNSTKLVTNPPACATHCGILSNTNALNLTIDSELALRYEGCHDSASYNGISCSTLERSCYTCYCSIAVQSFAAMKYCSPFWAQYILQALIIVAAACITTATNKALYYFSYYTNPIERHHTVSAEKRSLTLKLFIAQFTNTALSTIVANMYIPVVYKRLQDTPFSSLLFQGTYGDLVPGWYAQVGQSITVIVIFTVGLLHPAFVCYRLALYRWHVRGRKSCLTQQQLVEAYEGPDFELSSRYGEMLNILFCTLMFSSGLPLLLPCVAIIFTITYWAEKWELLKLSRVPDPSAGDLAALTGTLLPFAAVFHLMFSVWAFSWAKYPQPSTSHLAKSIFGDYVRRAGYVIRDVLFEGVHLQDFGERVLQPNAIQHCLALVILLALLLVQLFGRQILNLLGQALPILGIERSNKVKLTNLPSLAIALRSRLLIGPGSYSMENSDKYAKAFASQESLDQKDAQPKRKSDKKQGKPKKNKGKQRRELTAAGTPRDDASEALLV